MEQLRKLYWPLGVGSACLILALWLGVGAVNIGAIIYKFLVFGFAVSLVHILRLRLLPYLDMSRIYAERGERIEAAAWIIGTFYFYCKMTETLVRAF
jgi:hypothetical protein